MTIPRRNFLIGTASLLAAPAIVKASSLMPVRKRLLYPLPPSAPITAFEVLTQQKLALEKAWEEIAELIVWPPIESSAVETMARVAQHAERRRELLLRLLPR